MEWHGKFQIIPFQVYDQYEAYKREVQIKYIENELYRLYKVEWHKQFLIIPIQVLKYDQYGALMGVYWDTFQIEHIEFTL